MPSRLPSPVLSVDMSHIAKVDPSNVDNLFSMWTIFSKCAESLENGKRLENLSWRLWNRETFCCDDNSATKAIPVRKPKRQDSDAYPDMPELSVSVESATSEYDIPKESQLEALNIKSTRPCLIRRDSSERYRGKEKHMTPVHLVKLMEDMDKSKSPSEDWVPPKKSCELPPSPSKKAESPVIKKSTMSPPVVSYVQSTTLNVGSESSHTSEQSTHSVVRGFSPTHISSSYRSVPRMSTESEPVCQQVTQTPSKKNHKMFFLGSSASDDGSDLENSYPLHNHRSKLSEGLRGSKRTSFRDEVSTRTVYGDDDEYTEDDEVISESAIEDDDSSDWESSTESAHSSFEERPMFQRVKSKPQLASRRSLLSTMLHSPNRAAILANGGSKSTPALRSRTTSPSGPSLAASPSRDSFLTSKATAEITRSKPIIMTTTNTHPPALSPRTTRRNMLATELTESLRRHLLWERSQKNTTAAAVLKRRHTAHDVTKLVEYPQANASKNNSWNNCFGQDFNAQGW